MQSFGIVLKNCAPQKQKYLVLDRERGVIELVPPGTLTNVLCNGALLSYHITAFKRCFMATRIDQLDVPFEWARHDILFLHHVLELVCFFLPAHLANAAVFCHLKQLYEVRQSPLLYKKLFIAQLFLLLGMGVESPFFQSGQLHKAVGGLCNPGLEQYPDLQSIAAVESELDSWLLACVADHPQAAHLQTLRFYE